MTPRIAVAATLLLLPSLCAAQAPTNNPAWIQRSNTFTQKVIDLETKYSPEEGSHNGFAQFDADVSVPTLANMLAEDKEATDLAGQFEAQIKKEKDPNVAEDLQILADNERLGIRIDNYTENHRVRFRNPTSWVFSGLKILLDDQVPTERRQAAVARLKSYAGITPGYRPLATIMMERTQSQMAKPGILYPSRRELETQLARNATIVKGIADLFQKYNLTGWQEPFDTLKKQLADYDAWQRATVLPKATTDTRLQPEEYALKLENAGVDIPPDQLAAMAHKAFTEIQSQMAPLAAEIAKAHNWPSTDYRDVVAQLKKNQIAGVDILPLYTDHLHAIEQIIRDHQLVTLPDRPAIIEVATAAESAQQPAPHMRPPPLVHNTGQRGVFILPLNIPAGPGEAASTKLDDFSYEAASWTLIAHEARPGHELQFDSMVERGVSLARAIYAGNSTNVEGWGLYSEYIVQPYLPREGQLITLQNRLVRAARAFLDPELESGKIQPDQAMTILTHDVCLSAPLANEEVERYTFRAPGQATSYFYGYTRMLDLRQQTESALGPKFNLQRFHDFILAQGLLPPGLMKKAVVEEFIPEEKTRP